MWRECQSIFLQIPLNEVTELGDQIRLTSCEVIELGDFCRHICWTKLFKELTS